MNTKKFKVWHNVGKEYLIGGFFLSEDGELYRKYKSGKFSHIKSKMYKLIWS
jgi:hypothetical protein